MTQLKRQLPGKSNRIFLTDGGLETTLIFHDGYDLPYFAAFTLLNDAGGRKTLRHYFETYASLAVNHHAGFILETPTWRASSDWAEKMGYDAQQMHEFNRQAVELMREVEQDFALPDCPFVISGCVGPRGDGYVVGQQMTPQQACDYHKVQINSFAQSKVDIVSAITMTYPDEAIGIVNAARELQLPVVTSFTTETDGRLPNGMSLQEAIEIVDAATDSAPLYYMINCAHPDHFTQALQQGESWVQRIRGVRANASRKSHAELDDSETLDAGNPDELAMQYQSLIRDFPQFTVLGGCCGTDHTHIGKIGSHCCALA